MAGLIDDRTVPSLGAEATVSGAEPLGTFATGDGPAATPVLELHRQRQPGFGYGRSGGYGTRLHFTDGHVDAMFRSHW